jgi:hypothetical protein
LTEFSDYCDNAAGDVMWERLVEERIREAMAQGAFDNLPGQGQPIDLTRYFALPEESRVAFTLLRDHNIVPEEVQLLRDIGALRAQLAGCADDNQRRAVIQTLNEKQMALAMLLEQRHKSK